MGRDPRDFVFRVQGLGLGFRVQGLYKLFRVRVPSFVRFCAGFDRVLTEFRLLLSKQFVFNLVLRV